MFGEASYQVMKNPTVKIGFDERLRHDCFVYFPSHGTVIQKKLHLIFFSSIQHKLIPERRQDEMFPKLVDEREIGQDGTSARDRYNFRPVIRPLYTLRWRAW